MIMVMNEQLFYKERPSILIRLMKLIKASLTDLIIDPIFAETSNDILF